MDELVKKAIQKVTALKKTLELIPWKDNEP